MEPIPARAAREERPRPSGGLGQLATQLTTLWGRQSAARRAIAVVLLIATIGVVAWTRLKPSGPVAAEVTPGASPDDASELASVLGARGISYTIENGHVRVAADRLAEARAIASAAGLPRSGAGFELFDHTSLGQSAFAEQVNYRRALQGELSRSITTMAQVEGARVHLALGRRSVFKDGDEPPSASVALRMHAGQQLTREQVQGIRQLVAGSLDGLKPDAVVVIDNHGTPLDATQAGPDDQRSAIERTIAGRVRTMLETAVGTGNVAVVATAEVDTSKVSETEELYDKDATALRSEARTIDGPNAVSTAGGIAGVRGNLPGTTATTGTTAGDGHVQETRNFEVSRTVRNTTQPDVRLRRIHLAILIDEKVDASGKPVASTPDEMAGYTAIARKAAGVDDARGDQVEIRSIPFLTEIDPAIAPPPAIAAPGLPIVTIIAAGGGALILILIAMFVLRGRGRRGRSGTEVLALPAPLADFERSLDAPVHAGTTRALGPGPSVHGRALAAVRADTPRAAAILTSWLAEPAKGGRA